MECRLRVVSSALAVSLPLQSLRPFSALQRCALRIKKLFCAADPIHLPGGRTACSELLRGDERSFRSLKPAGREGLLVADRRRPGDGSECPVSDGQLSDHDPRSAIACTGAGQSHYLNWCTRA